MLQTGDVLVENFHQDCAHDGRDDDAHQARPHKAMVQQVLADNGGARTVEIHGRNVRRVIRNKEVAVYAREYAQEHRALDAEAIGEREHGDHDCALRIDEHAHRKERECDGPRVMLHDILEASLHHVHVVREVGVGEPGDSVNGDDGDHAALPHGARHGLLGTRLAADNHERRGRYHYNLDDDVHGERFYLRYAVNNLAGGELRANVVARNLHNGEEYDDGESTEENEHGALRFLGDFLVEHGSGIPVHVFLHLRVLEAGLECRVLVEVEPALVRDGCRGHDPAKARGNRNRDDLQVIDVESVCVRDDDERGDGCCNGRAGDADLRCDGGHAAGAFRADSLLERDIADNRHEGVNHVAGAYENREEERAERSENRDMVRVLAQQALRNLDQPIHAARCLQNACAGHRRDDDVNDIGRRFAGL